MLWATVLYPNQKDAEFNFEYYMREHVPMVAELLNTKIEVCKGIAPTTPNGSVRLRGKNPD